jgi:DNA-binding transcriptional LysR family regulator
MIDPRLQTLRVLSAEGTVTAAAAALYVTPSTVSQQLRQLSAELGVRLLEPEGRRVRLTAAAHTLLAHADELHAQWERATADLQTHRVGEAGHLRVSGVATALATLVAPAMRTLQRRHPRMTFEVGEDAGTDRFRLLLAGRTDIAIVIPAPDSPPRDDARFEQHVLLEEPQDLLVPGEHRFAARGPIDLREAAEETWIRAGDPQDQHQLLLSACAAAGFTPHLAHNAVDWFAIGAMVAHGYGICLMPRLAPLPPGLDVSRVPLTGKSAPTRQLIACIRRGSSQQIHVKRGIDALRDAAAEWAML